MTSRSESPDIPALRARASQMLAAGRLPSRAPERSWGGPGSGEPCSLCAVPIPRAELEFELEFRADDGEVSGTSTVRFHTHCFDVWLQARKDAGPR